MAKRFRWGILGLGNIAHQFARGLASLPDAELLAVASRSQEKADRFGEKFGAPRRYGDYASLAADPDVDAVYVSTPHSFHKENSILCLRAGKAVLCEKPFTINRGEAEEVVAVAVEEGRFVMEAMWTRFLPVMAQVREWVVEGAIGEVRMVQADFGFRTSIDEESRLFDPAFGGGGLLDVGVYAVSFASMVFGGPPDEIATLADIGQTNVDEQATMCLKYRSGGLALLACGVRTETPQEAWVMGTEGMIHVHGPFWRGDKVTLTRAGKKAEEVRLPYEGNGYNCEAAEVAACVRAGRLESELMPHAESLSIMETMDRIRAEWGLKYPME